MPIWKTLGNLALALHAAWVLAVVLAPLWAWGRPRWRKVHLGLMLATLAFATTLGTCPLTYVENWFWVRSDPSSAYRDGFLIHYLWEIVYWDVPQPWLNWVSGLWFLLWSGLYAWLWDRERRAGKRKLSD